MERLDKLLASRGCGSRRDVQKYIRRGEVAVNGEVCKAPERKVDPGADAIELRGQAVSADEHVYIMLNKPAGVVSATEDSRDRTVIDILPEEFRRRGLFPAGRLDKDTEGLLIITDDGDFAHRMLSPKKHVLKRYRAVLDGGVGEREIEQFANGIVFRDGEKCLPARLEIPDKNKRNEVIVGIYEGKFHQVKKMFAVCGKKVVQLQRISIGNLYLDGKLPIGGAKFLSNLEIEAIFIGNMH